MRQVHIATRMRDLTANVPAESTKMAKYMPPMSAPSAPVYSVRDGMRWVEAYDYVHRVGVRERWAGKQLLQVFKDEFAALPASYYVRAPTLRCSLLTARRRPLSL